ncbi:MAG: hypothetical protein J6A63_04910, partial [Clostridia bacterium]|nr:hypothetical protein [Clostridia bacterium]
NTFISDPITTTDGVDPITAYLGTYGTYSTFSSSLVSYLGGSTNYAAQLATLINKETADAQVKADKELKDLDLSGIYSTYSEAATVTLPNAAQYFEGVTISYEITTGDTVATVSGNTLTVTPSSTTTNVTLKVTVTVGGKTATKNINFTVEEPKVFVTVDTPAVNTEYIYYYYHTQNQKNYYFTGYKYGDYYFSASENAADAVGLYLETVTGGYNVYYLKNNAKTYLVVYLSGNYVTAKTTTTKADASVFTYNTEYKTLLTAVPEKGNYFLGTYGSNTDCRLPAESYIPEGDYVTHFGEYKKVSEITDAEKVAHEKLSFNPSIDETVAEDKMINVPVVGATYKEVTIEWNSSNAAVATVNGNQITFNQGAIDQQVTLLAQFYVNGAVVGAPITFQVTVKSVVPQPVQGTVEEFAIAANTGTSGTKSLSWSSEHFNFLAEQANSTTTIRTSDSSHYRAYKGSTFKISSKNGEGIKQIVFTCEPESYGGNYANPMVDSLTTEGLTATVSGQTVTVVVNEGTVTEVLFTATAQFRINKIVITYA